MNNKEEHDTKIKHLQPHRKISVFGVLWLIVLIFCGIGVIAAMIANGNTNTKQPAKPSPIGATVSDAGFNFVVHSFKCGEKHLSTGELVVAAADAHGQFCRLNITVTNAGKTASSIRAYSQYLFNTKGQRFEYDAHATTVAAGNYIGAEINDDINPGNNVTADIVFDVPVDNVPTIAELHGDIDSQGVRINLQ